ncbi:WXG100 family type VII secretion target [Mycobacterium sp. ACS4331]|uniref:WXG100 family type VII secretion target n=1 Tax=Mycobacterium sp. ACS4331 TaxID=1834121 RepID=UPI0007FE2CA3|nr:WXG100 family type VII secretion target [Mycobacterium sp. ACS4331]OBF29130.1 hypothetical protein A5727_24085 [Mycobacterium sp. ACS4331]
MTAVGADVEQLRATSKQFTQAVEKLQSAVKGLNTIASNQSIWRGRDADQFRAEWKAQSLTSLNAAIKALQNGADALRRNADQQEAASRADGGAMTGVLDGTGTNAKNGAAPNGASELYKTLRTMDDSYDGVMIQEVVGPDGQKRLIVYLAGTDFEDSKRNAGRNLSLAAGNVDDETVKKIDRALREAGYDPSDRSKQPEMMFVGYSQGGMEAQNLVASGRYNATSLVTYGSPLVHADREGVATVHLRAHGDNTPNLPAEAMAAARRDPISFALLRADVINGPGDRTPLLSPLAGESKNLYESDGGSQQVDLSNPMSVVEAGLTGNHGDVSVYTDVGADFDKSSDPKFSAQRDTMDKFQGSVTYTWEGDKAPAKSSGGGGGGDTW